MSNIQDALVAVKPHILDFQTTDFAVLEASLVRLNELLEQFTSARANKKRGTAEPAADELDREGVRLWNASILLRGVLDQSEPEARKRVFASRE
ncbi:hypothetical protein FRC12_020536 [Ceratobasidium sp. 428]|nr:hypothetical protein FRC12_020536 [Ceratobasidium sp. 428]